MPMTTTLHLNRRLHPGLVLGLVGAAFLCLGAMPRQDAARFERIEIVRDGRVVAELTGDANGGVIRLLDAAGGQVMDVRIGAGDAGAEIRLDGAPGVPGVPGVRIVAGPADRQRVLYDAASPPISDESIKVIAVQVSDVIDEVRNLAARHDALDDDVRDLKPGLSTNSTIDRLLRDINELRRGQDDLERDLRQLSDESSRRRMDVSSLERRIQRLESRIR